MRVTLRVLAGPYTGREFIFDQHDTFLIGRADTAHLYLPEDKFFSRHDCREELKRQPQPVPGYEMIKLLGRGGMGCVMLARDEKTGRSVAIKTLLPEVAVTDVSLRRFMREIQVASALDHPNIVRFLESGTKNGSVYLVTEFVEGSDAARLADAQGGRLP